MVAYILIIVASVHNGFTVSQQEYQSKERCEAAVIVIEQTAKAARKGFWNESNFQTRCVMK
jgi:hypothetical protein